MKAFSIEALGNSDAVEWAAVLTDENLDGRNAITYALTMALPGDRELETTVALQGLAAAVVARIQGNYAADTRDLHPEVDKWVDSHRGFLSPGLVSEAIVVISNAITMAPKIIQAIKESTDGPILNGRGQQIGDTIRIGMCWLGMAEDLRFRVKLKQSDYHKLVTAAKQAGSKG